METWEQFDISFAGAWSTSRLATGMTQPADVVELAITAQVMHHESVEVEIEAITPESFQQDHASQVVKFDKLLADFMKICPDIGNVTAAANKAVGFCQQVLYTISPEARQVTGKMRDRCWKCKFTEEAVSKVAMVATFKNVDKAGAYRYKATDNKVILSLRLANMLAAYILCKVVRVTESIIFTPLAGAVYSVSDISDMATYLGIDEVQTCVLIIQSTVSGSQLMPESSADCAVAATVSTTNRMKKKDEAASIVRRLANGMFANNKVLTDEGLAFWSHYARGGLPEGFGYDDIVSKCTKKPNLKNKKKKAGQGSGVQLSPN